MSDKMTNPVLRTLFLFTLLTVASHSDASDKFSFAVIAHPLTAANGESVLRTAIEQTDAANLAFVIANGIKAADEPCSDAVYSQRKTLLSSAKNGLIVSLAASDWTTCKDEYGKSEAIGRLVRMRELFFPDEFSFGATRIPLVRQSAVARFRTYIENARWEIGDIVFATINLPANNNHFLDEAGRNSEFEDRLVANRNWLHQIFTYARYKKLRGVVLFADGDPLALQGRTRGKRDGFLETRRLITMSVAKFPGKVLIIHGPDPTLHSGATGIHWNGKLGDLAIGPGWTKITVDPAHASGFEPDPVPSTEQGHQGQAREHSR